MYFDKRCLSSGSATAQDLRDRGPARLLLGCRVELGYTQAAISQQIAALESDLKVPLLNRRPVTPTEAGGRLLEHAEPILLRLDAARADVTRMTLPPSATLVVGATPLAGGSPLLALALAALRQRMPRLDVTVRVGPRRAACSPRSRAATLTSG